MAGIPGAAPRKGSAAILKLAEIIRDRVAGDLPEVLALFEEIEIRLGEPLGGCLKSCRKGVTDAAGGGA